MTRKEAHNLLECYFTGIKHNIFFVRVGKETIIDIEYEDFRPEMVVECEVRHFIGSGFLLNVKRECSPELMQEIKDILYSVDGSNRLMMHLMSSYCPNGI